jgi:hypothetical protein
MLDPLGLADGIRRHGTSWRRFPSALPIQNSMIKQPTIPSFLLRSRAFWLTVFTQLFFSWAWWDSTKFSTVIYYTPNGVRHHSMESYNGGIFVSSERQPSILDNVFNQRYQSKSHAIRLYRGHRFKYDDDHGLGYIGTGGFNFVFTPSISDIRYFTLMVLILALSISWLGWRWHRMKKACVVNAGFGRDG